MAPPLGIRNNNPCNIRKTDINWKGEVASANQFECFDTPVDGLRAAMRLLLSYYIKYGLNTVQSIVNRWAPPSENDTIAYQCDVAGRLGVNTLAKIILTDPEILKRFTCAIVLHENGRPPLGGPWPENWYSDDVYSQAVRMVLGHG